MFKYSSNNWNYGIISLSVALSENIYFIFTYAYSYVSKRFFKHLKIHRTNGGSYLWKCGLKAAALQAVNSTSCLCTFRFYHKLFLKLSTWLSVSSGPASPQCSRAGASAAPQIMQRGTWPPLNQHRTLVLHSPGALFYWGFTEEPGSLLTATELSLVPALLDLSGVVFHVTGEWGHLSV